MSDQTDIKYSQMELVRGSSYLSIKLKVLITSSFKPQTETNERWNDLNLWCTSLIFITRRIMHIRFKNSFELAIKIRCPSLSDKDFNNSPSPKYCISILHQFCMDAIDWTTLAFPFPYQFSSYIAIVWHTLDCNSGNVIHLIECNSS